jgi:hypothetical protein
VPPGSVPPPRRRATGARTERTAGPCAASRRLAAGRRTAPTERDQQSRAGSDVAAEAAEKVTTTHRGVRWERTAGGRIRWRDEDQQRWVTWRPGQDAPPRPAGWVVEEPLGSPLRDRRARAGWRSPYRLVPVALVALIVVVGAIQADRHRTPAAGTAADQAAAKLLHHCLATDGTADGQPIYEAGSVSCTSPKASVQVIAVLSRAAAATGSCPRGTSSVRLAAPGVSSPPVLCVAPVGG